MCTPSWIFSPPNLSPAVHCHICLSPTLCALVQESFKQEELYIGLLWAVYLSFGPSSSKGSHNHEAHFKGLARVWSHSSHLLLHKKKAPTIVISTFGLIKNIIGFLRIWDLHLWFIHWNLIEIIYSSQNILMFINTMLSKLPFTFMWFSKNKQWK